MKSQTRFASSFRTLAATMLLMGGVLAAPARAQEGLALPAPAQDAAPSQAATDTAVFAGRCC